MKLTRRERTLIIAGLAIVLAAAYVFYFLVPYFNDTAAASLELVQTGSKIKLLQMQQGMADKLREEIETLTARIAEEGASMHRGIDDARTLLYLQKLTDGRAVDVSVSSTGEPELKDGFLQQAVTLDFRASYPSLLEIIGELKDNALYNRVTFFRAEYRPAAGTAPATASDATPAAAPSTAKPAETPGESPAATASPASTPAATPAATPAPGETPDANVMAVHIEFVFYGLPEDGERQGTPPLAPATGGNAEDLFPSR